jgi:peptidyl-prolyl cis-trans isomerase A (cyclophilin A)
MKRNVLLLACLVLSCREKAAPEPRPDPQTQTETPTQTDAPKHAAGAGAPNVQASQVPCTGAAHAAPVPVTPGDPVGGHFDLNDATRGLPPGDHLSAKIETSHGTLTCDLLADKAPITVANFVGLARGVRPWKDPKSGQWVRRPAYDGTIFHRIIKGFMIQGGDPKGDGSGEPGYVIPDEVWPCAHHDHAGELCMANRGPNTNGAQFFITDAAATHLDSGYTIFGECKPEAVIHMIAGVPTGAMDRPVSPVTIRKITITRTSAGASSRVPYAGAPRDH